MAYAVQAVPLPGQQMEGWIKAAQHLAKMALEGKRMAYAVPVVPLDAMPQPPADPVGLDLDDLRLEHGDVLLAVTDDPRIRVFKGHTFRARRDPHVGIAVDVPSGSLSTNYKGAKFVVVARSMKPEAL